MMAEKQIELRRRFAGLMEVHRLEELHFTKKYRNSELVGDNLAQVQVKIEKDLLAGFTRKALTQRKFELARLNNPAMDTCDFTIRGVAISESDLLELLDQAYALGRSSAGESISLFNNTEVNNYAVKNS